MPFICVVSWLWNRPDSCLDNQLNNKINKYPLNENVYAAKVDIFSHTTKLF